MKTKKWKNWLVAGVILSSLTACSTGGSGSNAGESDYPKKPITVVAPSGAGGGWDLTARSLTKILGETKTVDQTMTVENKPGGGGAVYLAEFATQHKKDDYKLYVNSPPILINNLKKEGNSPYGFKDTTPLAQLTKDFGAIVVKEDSKYNNLKELMEAVKNDPKSVTAAGGSAPGSMDHLVAVLPAYKSDIDPKTVKYVSYDGGGEAIAALLGGNADYIATDASAVGEYLKAGKVKVLGISSTERLKGDLADVPTFKEAGIDADFTIWRGVFGPKEMSDSAVAYWDKTLKKLNESKEWQDELERNGWESEFKDGKEFETFLKDQEKQVEDLLKSLGMNK
ncbi:Bug family tripartite tricarboxylate transporter substrate binding protein [Fictibacillus norfolkensis]|uniref:Tripartite tricarboxylate transporter substrate binding protein n=1 Tax=Fictibacillus norfolkensis TaxID=2762233 RepID=A0ABR8SKX2_9BACL|nr:tripartite tricarboxylate transporter substrate binding protein [Fictibacillus norfolkensis]MBD7964033.1 tripartite tricarboxylate transporter substrate binding protein [Fictibacillus norfolkensis]